MTVQEGGILVVDLAFPSGLMIFLRRVAGIKEAHLGSVGSDGGNIMTVVCKDANLVSLLTFDVYNNVSAVLQTSQHFCLIVGVAVLQTITLGYKRREHRQIGPRPVIGAAVLGEPNALLYGKTSRGKRIHSHAKATRAAPRFCYGRKLIENTLILGLSDIRYVGIVLLIQIQHILFLSCVL